ncbi:hypothetical protein HDU67_001330 [Dinochytrium kinnereticum]|nr:hypothetical protein HDU67_001330 [Dinochytrium kinnereticum]
MVRPPKSSSPPKKGASAKPATTNGKGVAYPKVTLDERDAGMRLICEVLDVGREKVEVSFKPGHGAPTASLPSGAQVTGTMTIAKYLLTLTSSPPDLLGKTDADRTVVEQRMDTVTSLTRSLIPQSSPASEEDGKRINEVLCGLDEELKGRTFFGTGYLTVTDLALYAGLFVAVATMSLGGRLGVSNVTRYFDLIQNLVAEMGKKTHLDMVDIDLDARIDAPAAPEAKKEAAAPKDGGKKDKGKKEKGAANGGPAPAEKEGKGKEGKKKVDGEKAVVKTEKSEGKEEKKEEKKKAVEAVVAVAAAEAAPADLPPGEPERLDLRVGRIVSVQRHAQADTLYVEEVDLGEDKPRTVVSGLVKYMKESDLQGRLVVLLCNLKPQKMRGIESQAMVLATTSTDGTIVELLDAPKGAAPGDRCWFDTHPGTDFSQLNPKKKVWEGVQPRLKTDGTRRAVYVNVEAGVKTVNVLRCAKGEVTVKSVVGGSIK